MAAIHKLSIVIPVYNEGRTVREILDLVRGVELVGGISKEVIIVDDGSKDDTVSILNEYIAEYPGAGFQLFEHGVNQGKGAALHTGIAKATGDYVIIQDADLEYDPD